jgi:hypothetical protein
MKITIARDNFMEVKNVSYDAPALRCLHNAPRRIQTLEKVVIAVEKPRTDQLRNAKRW